MEPRGKESTGDVEMAVVPDISRGHPDPPGSRHPVCPFSELENSEAEKGHRKRSLRKLCILMIFCFAVMVAEVVGGMKANSLAVLADAAHMLTDIVGLAISLLAVWASGWKATSNYSFGFNRLEVLGALFSMQLIWLLSGLLIYEAFGRLLHEGEAVDGKLMFSVAAFGFAVNFIMVTWLGHDHHVHHHVHHHDHHNHHHHHHRHSNEELCPLAKSEANESDLDSDSTIKSKRLNINLQGAYLHIIADLIQSVGVMITGAIIWVAPNWLAVDLISTLIFSVLVICTTLPLIRSILYIMMERTPPEIDADALQDNLKRIKGVDNVSDLHVWAVTLGKVVMSCHIVAESGVAHYEVVSNVEDYCRSMYKIHHITIQVE
ncbi:hypothetical protein MLD38_011560 [Melastoma candidum]|uniref:Uncharacterized protein n=1 Tax=Melastoma candidum TaxID=119954 RepID=A0ACB9R3H9_9MYRT|nr:hypothetical protein MLD38_011560 [Melastoma candidum]